VRQLLAESVLLALLGGAAGWLFAPLCLHLLVNYLPGPGRLALDVTPDARVLAFTFVVSVLTGLLFGIAPALRATRLNLTAALKDAAQSRTRFELGKLLVVAQVALSLCLLVGAGLFVRSLRNLRMLDAGMNYENVVQFTLDTDTGYDAARRGALYQQMLARLTALPGVEAATLSSFGLLSGSASFLDVVTSGEKVRCQVLEVGPRYFETLRQPILSGRDFTAADERPVAASDQAAPDYAIINQTMARQFFGTANPIGQRLQAISMVAGSKPLEIIGVAQDARVTRLHEAPTATFYLYYFQQPDRSEKTFQLRVTGDPARYAAALRRVVRELDAQAQVIDWRTLPEIANDSLVQERFVAQTTSAFGLFALLLAALGLYGVMSQAVTRRTSEIGIRLALGAQPRDVIGWVLGQGLKLILAGLALGLIAALMLTRLLKGFLFGVSATDPPTFALIALLLLCVALAACWLPARRAATVDPLIALRHE
jgi:predicted permease